MERFPSGKIAGGTPFQALPAFGRSSNEVEGLRPKSAITLTFGVEMKLWCEGKQRKTEGVP